MVVADELVVDHLAREVEHLSPQQVAAVVDSLPWAMVNMWSSENAGGFLDHNAEIELWTRAGHIKVNLQKGIDIRKLDKLIADSVLGSH